MKRSPIRRNAGLKARSDKRAALMKNERVPLVLEQLAARPTCEAAIVTVCTGRSEHLHEPLTRARGGSITDVANTVAVCHPCHRWIHAHVYEATQLGLLRPSWEATA